MSLPRVDTMRPTSPLAAWVPIGLGAFVVLGIALNVSNPPGLLAFVPYAVVGSLLVARRPHNVIGWLLVVMAIAFSLVGRGLDVAAAVYGTPWAPWLPIFAWVVLGAILVCTVGLVFRFRTAGTIERQQDKWFLASLAALISAISFGFVGASFTGGNDAWVWFPALSSFPLPAIAIGIAITRYRLYDIDRVISRTIAYAGVTVVLFAVFAIVNVVIRLVLEPVVGGGSVAVAASTLAIAALFSPLRTRLQRLVDRRFNRGRRDAELTVDRFAGRLRDQLDLGSIGHELTDAAVASVEPASATVWLRRPEAARVGAAIP